jgi:L-amino acid N-acyltransferase YncA/DNA-binding transcriptional ArsR family regulator
MNSAHLSRAAAQQYAGWFRVLADPARVQIVSVLAAAPGPLSVPQIVSVARLSPASVAQYLRVLVASRLVLAAQPGAAQPGAAQPGAAQPAAGRRYRLSPAAVAAFPSAADVTAGRPAPPPPVSPPAARPAVPAAPVTIRPMRATDAAQVLAVYQAGLDTGQASFETRAPSWTAFDAARLPDHRLVATDDRGRLLGWVAVAAVSGRCVYAGVVEHSVYVDPAAQRRGAGLALLTALIASTEAAGIWTIQSGIFPENRASLRLHERAGFRVVGVRHRLGQQHGRWRDVVLIERRAAGR